VIGTADATFIDKAKRIITRLIDRSEILLLDFHDFALLQSVCARGIVLDQGDVIHDGPIAEAIGPCKKVNGLAA